MEGQREIELTEAEVGPIAALGMQIEQLTQQRNGMIVYIASLKGVSNSAIDIRGNRLIVTPRGEQK